MNDVSRRSVLLAAGVALLPNNIVRGEESPKKGARERFAVGPIPLGDFLAPIVQRIRDATDAPLDEVQKALGTIELFAVDDRVWDGNEWQLGEVTDSVRPHLAIAGDLALTITGSKSKKFGVAVKSLNATGIDTYHASPNWRAFHVALKVNVWAS